MALQRPVSQCERVALADAIYSFTPDNTHLVVGMTDSLGKAKVAMFGPVSDAALTDSGACTLTALSAIVSHASDVEFTDDDNMIVCDGSRGCVYVYGKDGSCTSFSAYLPASMAWANGQLVVLPALVNCAFIFE